MTDTTTTQQAAAPAFNEFGEATNQLQTPNLNTAGKEVSLADLLAKLDERLPAKTPAAPGNIQDAQSLIKEPAKVADAAKDPVAGANVSTGSKALDIAVSSFLKSTGATDADIQRASALALERGDSALIDSHFLQDKFGDRADEAKALVEAVLEQASVQKDALVASVFATAGSKEAWDQSLATYKEHAPAGLQRVLKTMFDSGDAAAVKEAAGLVVEFAKNSGAITVSGSRVTPGSNESAAQGLSASQFQEAVGKLNQSSRTYRADYNKLIDLRRLGKSVGK